jgi:hypothetical protein
MTVMGESRDWADKGTNQAMSAGYKTGLLEMFLIPLEETVDTDSESPVGAPAEEEGELTVDELEYRRQVIKIKTELVEILGTKNLAASFWETHQGMSGDEMLAEARKQRDATEAGDSTPDPGLVDDRLEKLAGRVLGSVPDKKGPLAQGIKEMFDFGWKLELIGPDWLDNQLDDVKTITDLSVEERQVLYKSLQKELATPLRDAQKAAAGR